MQYSARPRIRHIFIAAAALAAALVVAAPLAGPSSSATAVEVHASSAQLATASSKSKTVPNVVGKSASDAKAALKKVGLSYSYSPPSGSVVVLAKNWTVTKQSPKAGSKVKPGTKIKLTVVKSSSLKAAPTAAPTPAGPVLSVAQQQALLAAKGYLSSGMGFSYQGLIDQLTSPYGNGFAAVDATAAVDSLHADWNAQAVIAAKGYLSSGQGFSHQSLVEQLSSAYGNKFTPEQAEYAAGQVGL